MENLKSTACKGEVYAVRFGDGSVMLHLQGRIAENLHKAANAVNNALHFGGGWNAANLLTGLIWRDDLEGLAAKPCRIVRGRKGETYADYDTGLDEMLDGISKGLEPVRRMTAESERAARADVLARMRRACGLPDGGADGRGKGGAE